MAAGHVVPRCEARAPALRVPGPEQATAGVSDIQPGGLVSVPTKRREVSGAVLPAESCPVREDCSRVPIDATSQRLPPLARFLLH